jgi:lactoylglutathione lyase
MRSDDRAFFLPSPVLTGSGSTGVISARLGAPRSEKGNVRVGMGDVEELRLVLTIADFEAAVALYRDALGLEQLEDWSVGDAKIVLDAGRATLELVNEEQAEVFDRIEVGSRVSGPVRIAFKVADSEATAERLARGDAERMQLTLFTTLA